MLSTLIHTIQVQLSPQKREERRVLRERAKQQRRMEHLAEEAAYYDKLIETLRTEAQKNRDEIVRISQGLE